MVVPEIKVASSMAIQVKMINLYKFIWHDSIFSFLMYGLVLSNNGYSVAEFEQISIVTQYAV